MSDSTRFADRVKENPGIVRRPSILGSDKPICQPERRLPFEETRIDGTEYDLSKQFKAMLSQSWKKARLKAVWVLIDVVTQLLSQRR